MIEFNGASKTYKSILGRAVKAVEDFSLSVPAGEVFGIAGPNGAGKSTLIAMLLGYIKPTSGSISIAGQAPRRYVEAYGVAYLSELIAIPPRWKAEVALTRFAILSGVEEQALAASVEGAVATLGIEEHRTKKIKALSKGNLQRVGIAQAVTQESEMFILDEPTHGLDPVWTQRFRDIVGALRRPNRAIIIASHNLDELQRLADRVAIIDHGRLQRIVNVRDPGEEIGEATYRIRVANRGELMKSAFPNAKDLGGGEYEVVAGSLDDLNRALATQMMNGLVVSSVTPAHSALERHFREAVRDTQ